MILENTPNPEVITEIVIIGAMIIVATIALVFVAMHFTKIIIDYFNACSAKLDEVSTSISNVVDGSKRMERNVDAINQRTKAHLVNKKPSTFLESRDYKKDYKGRRDGNKKTNIRKPYSVHDSSK